MSDGIKRENERPASQRPRSPRLPVNFAVTIAGNTSAGEPFSKQAEAVKVSRGGATLITDAQVRLGDVVQVTPPFGPSIEAEVNGAWIDPEDGQQRIGIKLLDANGWFAE